ncbi:MAG TPA: hypothetical protein VEW46_14850 [Pyrinomonadaceae bacterium]|nr:hypothetical protein [Pyrinomonadaceae bacterium]
MAKKTAAKKAAKGKAKIAAGIPGDCLSFSRAGRIVQECSNGPHDIDDTLEEVGLITENQRLVFRECVFNKVFEHGCKISREDIPNAADNTLREVRDTIAETAA